MMELYEILYYYQLINESGFWKIFIIFSKWLLADCMKVQIAITMRVTTISFYIFTETI